jgi:hypothetical protein
MKKSTTRYSFVYILVSMLVCFTPAKAQLSETTPSDSIEISLLTCTPGPVAYSMYGHSALRVNNYTDELDLVFNYGVFDYNEDNFVFKFLKGETDYLLGAEYTHGFFDRYKEEGAGVLEQVLNLTREECNNLNALLMENLEPDNRVYRYNWLYNNCTTRAQDMIEKSIQGTVRYLAADREQTARAILHEFNKVDRWMEFGENFILGYELDRQLTKRQQMFIPSLFAAEVDSAVIVRHDGTTVPLVRETRHPIERTSEVRPPQFDWPMLTFVLLFVAYAVAGIFELRRVKTFVWIDMVMSVLVGLAGLLITFLFFFSEHAGVDSNILIIIINPLTFAFIPFLLRRHTQPLNYAILAVFVLFAIACFALRQSFDPALWPLALTLLLRVVVNISVNHKKSLSLQTKTRNHSKKS